MATERNDMLPDEEAMLREARDLLRPLPESEPRPGFSARVAANAEESLRRRPFPLWRWAMGGALVASAAALLLMGRGPVAQPGPQVASLGSHELMLAQRLDLYEDLNVVQDQEALQELDVVSVLHELQAEGKP